ncbi:Mechanosensitive ion channel protein 1, mitochondrial, partial [Linum perenne]
PPFTHSALFCRFAFPASNSCLLIVGIRFLNRMVLRDSILPGRTWQQVFQSHSNSTMLARNSTGGLSRSLTASSPHRNHAPDFQLVRCLADGNNKLLFNSDSYSDSKSFTSISPALPGFYTRRTTSFSSISPLLIQRSYFSTSGGKSDKPSSQVSAGPGTDVGDGSRFGKILKGLGFKIFFISLLSLGKLHKTVMELQSACGGRVPISILRFTTPSHSSYRIGSSVQFGARLGRAGLGSLTNSGSKGVLRRFGLLSLKRDFGVRASRVKDVWHSAFNYTTEKAKETSDALTPHVQHVLDSYPYLKTVVVPVNYILVSIVFAWVVMPKLLRTFQRFSMQSPGGVLYTSIVGEVVPYDKSAWGALEDPVRYLITFMAFSQICTMVTPTTLAEQYIGQVWKGAMTISLVWFLYRWKANIISRAMASRDLEVADREKWLTFDKISSIGFFVIGLTAFAEASGVALQSILTVGGIGGVATAFAARDNLGNFLSGLSIQASKPFSLGDTIKASEVIEMGLTTTMLRNSEKFPVIVPNSLFSSQVIVNKSRARF